MSAADRPLSNLRFSSSQPIGSSDAGAGCRIERRYAALQASWARFARANELVAKLPPLSNLRFSSSQPIGSSDAGAGCRTRTDDLLITNQLLYQLS